MNNIERIIEIAGNLPKDKGVELLNCLIAEFEQNFLCQSQIVRIKDFIDNYPEKHEAQILSTSHTTTIPIGFGGDIHC